MNNASLIEKIKIRHTADVLKDYEEYGYLNVVIKPERIRDIVLHLKENPELQFEMLVDLVSIDYSKFPEPKPERFGLVYHFKSLTHNHRVAIRVFLKEEDPEIDSIHEFIQKC